jgi:Primase C terminal 2 (PriCT-2)/Protein of unknown function (DUF3987)
MIYEWSLLDFAESMRNPTIVDKKEKRAELLSMNIYKENTQRGKVNVISLTAATFDFDNTQNVKIKLTDFLQKLKSLNLVHIYYSTWSNTAECNRWRVIFPFSTPVPAENWPDDLHNRIVDLLGGETGLDTASSKDVARMWFAPCKRADQPYEFGFCMDGEFLDPHTLPQTAETISTATIITEHTNTLSERVYEALNRIDASCDYHTWIEMGMALQKEFGEAGFRKWDAWSSKSRKYKGVADLENRWKSFSPTGAKGIGSIFFEAKKNGYQNTKKEKIYEAPLESEEEVESDELVDPIQKCISDIEPFAVTDIFDFPNTVLRELFEWIQSAAPLPQAIFSLSTAISLLAFLKKHAVISSTGLRTNLYILTIGASRSGKNNGLNCIHQALDAVGNKDLAISSFGSAQGLVKQLSEKEGVAYWVQDEITHVFKSFQNRNAGTHETKLEQKILTLYNCSFQTSDRIKNEKVSVVDNPYLNIYGTTTENIIDYLNPESAVSGLLARFLVFWLKPDAPTALYNYKLDKALPVALLSKLKIINADKGNKPVYFDEQAKEWFANFCNQTQKNQRELCLASAKVDSLVGNLPEQTIKLALIATISSQMVEVTGENFKSEYQSATIITLKDIQWAASIAVHCFKNNIELAGLLTENKNEKLINQIVKFLQSKKNKWVRRSDICKLIRYALNVRQLDDLLQPLVESYQILRKETAKGGGVIYQDRATKKGKK